MTTAIIGFTRLLLLAIVVICGLVSIYAAVNAISVHSGHDVFVSGMAAIALAALVNPLFCFVAAWGMVRYLDLPTWQAVFLVLPVGLAWSAGAAKMAVGWLRS